MNAIKIFGIVLILAGTLALVYRSFSYTKETHEAKIGPLELQLKEKQTINIPTWAVWQRSLQAESCFWYR
jgi:hypothetical protein